MPVELSEKELSEFREIFDLVDSDGSGRITLQELRKLMETLHLRPTEEELEDIFGEAARGGTVGSSGAKADATGGASAMDFNTIDFNQFASIMSKRVQSDYTPEQLRSAFKLFETDDLPVGFVSRDVLKHALTTYGSVKLSKEEASHLLDSVDPSNTGLINYMEFVAMVSGEGESASSHDKSR